MAVLTEGKHTAEFVLSLANRTQSLENITIETPAKVVSGQVLGKKTAGAAAGVAGAGNTGDGTISAITLSTTAKAGVYKVTFIEPAADAGAFTVENPDGVQLASGEVGAAYSDEIGFTISDGATDFVAGDSFTVTVSDGNEKYVALDLSAIDGSAVAAGISYANYDATDADVKGVGVVRQAEVVAVELTWPDGISDPQKAAAIDQLKNSGILMR